MDCIAHRGFAGVNPENTVVAVRSAARRADWVEVDVRRCASGEVVVVHDERVDRVTASAGRVAEHTRADLAAMDVLDSGEGVPTLAAVRDALATEAGATGLNVELKERGLAADVTALLAGFDGPTLLSSFDAAALRAVEGDHPLALLAADATPETVERARDLGCRAVHPRWDCPASVIDRARDAGLAVNVWTARNEEAVRRARALDVDGLIADHPRFCGGA